MSPIPAPWDNLITYPDFIGNELSEDSLFWRVVSDHPFYTLAVNSGGGLVVENYHHDPVTVRNGSWGNRIFLKDGVDYEFGITCDTPVKIYAGLYEEGKNKPAVFWVLSPGEDNPERRESFSPTGLSRGVPLHLKLIIPDTRGETVHLKDVFLREKETALLPRVVAGIVTFNRKNNVASLLEQIRELNYSAECIDVVVVDNASADGTFEMLGERFPEVTVLRNTENLGGSGGFNTFFKYVAGLDGPPPFGWLIDDDAVIEKNTLIHLVRELVENSGAGVAGSVMMDLENPNMIYEAGGCLHADRFGWDANIINRPVVESAGWTVKTREAGYAGAYSLLFRTEVIKKAGIWRDYFLHVDDSEWCYRVRKITGQKVVIVLDSLIWHVLQGARKPFTFLRYYETRNFLDYFAHNGGVKAVLKVLCQCLGMGLRQFLIKREDLCGFHLKGIEDFIKDRFGRRDLSRNADFASNAAGLFELYEDETGEKPATVYLVREINDYAQDGVDHEGKIVAAVRELLPDSGLIEVTAGEGAESPLLCDGRIRLGRGRGRIRTLVNCIRGFCFPRKGIVILPFWNEGVEIANLASWVAVYEDGRFTVYRPGVLKRLGGFLKILGGVPGLFWKAARMKGGGTGSRVGIAD